VKYLPADGSVSGVTAMQKICGEGPAQGIDIAIEFLTVLALILASEQRLRLLLVCSLLALPRFCCGDRECICRIHVGRSA
jgi:hypothetical protein